jgi:hypothetical protein
MSTGPSGEEEDVEKAKEDANEAEEGKYIFLSTWVFAFVSHAYQHDIYFFSLDYILTLLFHTTKGPAVAMGRGAVLQSIKVYLRKASVSQSAQEVDLVNPPNQPHHPLAPR